MLKTKIIRPHLNIKKRITTTGLWHIKTKILLVVLFLLIVTCNVSIEQSTALRNDRYALEDNHTFEQAIANNYYELILSKYLKAPNGTHHFDGGTLTQIRPILEILAETDSITLLNDTLTHAIYEWVLRERRPIETGTFQESPAYQDNIQEVTLENNETVLMNNPQPVETSMICTNWWGSIIRSLEAAHILKLINYLDETVSNDIKQQIRAELGDIAWSPLNKEFSNTYDAFVTAYQYELFDLFTEYGLPKFDAQAVELAKQVGEEVIYPVEWGNVLSEENINLTFHAGHEKTYNYISGTNLVIDLPLVNEWFPTAVDSPIPYQQLFVNLNTSSLTNGENLTHAIEAGLVDEIYVLLDPLNEADILAYLQSNYNLEEVETNGTHTLYRYYEWDYDLVWYELHVQITDPTTNEILIDSYMAPDKREHEVPLDLITSDNISVTITVRQALHTFTYTFDNDEQSIPLEGWTNETNIVFQTEEIVHKNTSEQVIRNRIIGELDTTTNNLTIRIPYTIYTLENNSVKEIEEVTSYIASPNQPLVIEENDGTLHTFQYDNPYPSYEVPFKITHQIQPVVYGLVVKGEPEGQLFLEVTHPYISTGGLVITWSNTSSDPLELLRTTGEFTHGIMMDQLIYTHRSEPGAYHLLTYLDNEDNGKLVNLTNQDTLEPIPALVRVQQVIYNDDNPLEQYMNYYPFLDDSLTQFEKFAPNTSLMLETWEAVQKASNLLARICDVSLPQVTDIFPYLDVLFAYKNDSSSLFQDTLSETVRTWKTLDQMGFFLALVDDEELEKVYHQLFDNHYFEVFAEYLKETDGTKVYLLEKAGFANQKYQLSWDTQGTLAGIQLLKMIRARSPELLTEGKGALSKVLSGRHLPINLRAEQFPHYGMMWAYYSAKKAVEPDFSQLEVQQTNKIHQTLQHEYELTYEEIYEIPKIALSCESILIPHEMMYWRNIEEEQPEFHLPLLKWTIKESIYILLSASLISFLITNMGGNSRHKWWSGIWVIIFMVQAYGVPLASATNGVIPALEDQFRALQKITSYVKEELYAFSSHIRDQGRDALYEPLISADKHYIPCFTTESILTKPIEDRTIETAYQTYLHDYRRQYHRYEKLSYHSGGITVPLRQQWFEPLTFEAYVQTMYGVTVEGEINYQVGHQQLLAEETLAQLKLGIWGSLMDAGKKLDNAVNTVKANAFIQKLSFTRPKNSILTKLNMYALSRSIENDITMKDAAEIGLGNNNGASESMKKVVEEYTDIASLQIAKASEQNPIRQTPVDTVYLANTKTALYSSQVLRIVNVVANSGMGEKYKAIFISLGEKRVAELLGEKIDGTIDKATFMRKTTEILERKFNQEGDKWAYAWRTAYTESERDGGKSAVVILLVTNHTDNNELLCDLTSKFGTNINKTASWNARFITSILDPRDSFDIFATVAHKSDPIKLEGTQQRLDFSLEGAFDQIQIAGSDLRQQLHEIPTCIEIWHLCNTGTMDTSTLPARVIHDIGGRTSLTQPVSQKETMTEPGTLDLYLGTDGTTTKTEKIGEVDKPMGIRGITGTFHDYIRLTEVVVGKGRVQQNVDYWQRRIAEIETSFKIIANKESILKKFQCKENAGLWFLRIIETYLMTRDDYKEYYVNLEKKNLRIALPFDLRTTDNTELPSVCFCSIGVIRKFGEFAFTRLANENDPYFIRLIQILETLKSTTEDYESTITGVLLKMLLDVHAMAYKSGDMYEKQILDKLFPPLRNNFVITDNQKITRGGYAGYQKFDYVIKNLFDLCFGKWYTRQYASYFFKYEPGQEAVGQRFVISTTIPLPIEIIQRMKVIMGTGSSTEGLDYLIAKPQITPEGKISDKYDITIFEAKKVSTPNQKPIFIKWVLGKTIDWWAEKIEGKVAKNRKFKDIMISIPNESAITTLMALIHVYLGIPLGSRQQLIDPMHYRMGFFNDLQWEISQGSRLLTGVVTDSELGYSHKINGQRKTRSTFVVRFGSYYGTQKISSRSNFYNTLYLDPGGYDQNLMAAVKMAIDQTIENLAPKPEGGKYYYDYGTKLKTEFQTLLEDYETKIQQGKATAGDFLAEFFSQFREQMFRKYVDSMTLDTASEFYAMTRGYESFHIEFLNELIRRCIIVASPPHGSLASNFLFNGIPEELLSLDEKVQAITAAYYTNKGYEQIAYDGSGPIQGQIPMTGEMTNILTMLKPPAMENPTLTLDWGGDLATLNIYLDRVNPADYLITDLVRQVWDNTAHSTTLDVGNTYGSPEYTVIGVDHGGTINIPQTGLLSLLGSTVPLDMYPIVNWSWMNVPLSTISGVLYEYPNAPNVIVKSDTYHTYWNQGEIIFYIQNSEGKICTIGVQASQQLASDRSDNDWTVVPDVQLYIDPITWVQQQGYLAENGEVEIKTEWINPYIPEELNLYEMSREIFLEKEFSIEGLNLIGLRLSNKNFDLLGPYVINETHETYFGPFTFTSLPSSDMVYHQTVVKPYYYERYDADGTLSPAEIEAYTNEAYQLATGTHPFQTWFDYPEEVAPINKFYQQVKEKDIYDDFYEVIVHIIILVKDGPEGEYIGVINQSHVMPTDTELLNAPRWTSIPIPTLLPIYVYYDSGRDNGWDKELWWATASTFASDLGAIIVTEDELLAIMNESNPRSIVLMLGAIPGSLWGYQTTSLDTPSSTAQDLVEDHSLIEKYLDNGGTLIAAGPYGGLRAINYMENNGDQQLGDYREQNGVYPIFPDQSVVFDANVEEVLLDNVDPDLISADPLHETPHWMIGTNPAVSNYYSTGLYFSNTYGNYTDRILAVYGENGNYKDVALKVGQGIYVNYHTAPTNEQEGALNWSNIEGFVQDLITIVTDAHQYDHTAFIPHSEWLPSSSNYNHSYYAYEDFETGVSDWTNLTSHSLSSMNVGQFTDTTVSAIEGPFSDLTGINALEYPLLGAALNITEDWSVVNNELQEYCNFTNEYDSATGPKIEGQSAITFEYDLSDSDIVNNYTSVYDITNITIDSQVTCNFAIHPQLKDEVELETLDFTGDVYDLTLLKYPDTFMIRFTIDDGTGKTKELCYYYSYKAVYSYQGQYISDLPTNYTLIWDYQQSEWKRIANIPDNAVDTTHDSVRYISMNFPNNEWSYMNLDILADFNESFIVEESQITLTNIQISYLCGTYDDNNETSSNSFTIDDFIFLEKGGIDSYWLR